MGYDSKYQHGLSWLSNGEEDPCSRKILTALYAAIYDEESSRDVVRWLLQAYDAQWSFDNDDNDDASTTLFVTYTGQEAERYMRARWADAYKRHLDRHKIPYDDEGVDTSEAFEWPSSLPWDYPIRKGILKSIGQRMGAADAWLLKCLREAAVQDGHAVQKG